MNEKNVTLSMDEIIQLRTAIRARLRELNRMLKHCPDLPCVDDEKDILEPLYERLGDELDKFLITRRKT